ncbi:MAG: hypothetical protein Q9179_003602 [Wetmoreana sp. 5 TL-2023]
MSSPTQEELLEGSQQPTHSRSAGEHRGLLLFQACIWRWLAAIGFYLHKIPRPSPRQPSFQRSCSTAIIEDAKPSQLTLAFYVPRQYEDGVRTGRKFPVILNFHGGGFTIGTPTDDARWACMIVDRLDAVVISAQYRLAPEHPFPTAVDDGVAVLLWLGENADALGLDLQRIALSGFSAGGNMAFTVPLRLREHFGFESRLEMSQARVVPNVNAIVSWYPSLDYRLSRTERRATCVRPEKTLPPALTALFDKSYLPNPNDNQSPYVSPAAANDDTLKRVLPDNITLYLCEWDMLQKEGADFGERLSGLNKHVHCVTIRERRHGFDKSPWPFSVDPVITRHYEDACQFLKEVL